MPTSTCPPAELFEPYKNDPGNPRQQAAREEAFEQYRQLAGSNPFVGKPFFRHGLKDHETRRPPPPAIKTTDPIEHVWIVDHPALRGKYSRQELDKMNQTVSGHLNSPASPLSLHNRTNPEPLSKLASDQGFRKPGSANSNFTKSSSDSNVLRPKVSTLSISENRSPERKRKVSFPNMLRSPTKQSLDTIDEQDDLARNYRVEVQHPGSEEKVVRSPLKKLFGDKGMLGKSASAKDFSDSGSKKTGFAHWSGKIKSRVDDMTQELTEKIQNFEISHKRSPSGGPSNFPVSLSPYVQGDFYMQLELLLNIESNNFLMHELEADRISVSSIKTIAEQWRNKGRPQVLGLRFDLITQRELVGLNVETMHFSGVNSFHKQRLLGVLAAWRVLAKEISIRTFCQPDSAVKKHLHDAEKVLEAMNASGDSMLAFQEMRSRVTTEIYKEERLDTERRVYNGVQRQWSPSKKHAARF